MKAIDPNKVNLPKIVKVGGISAGIAAAATLLLSILIPARYARHMWWGPVVNSLILYGMLGAIGGVLIARYVYTPWKQRRGKGEDQ